MNAKPAQPSQQGFKPKTVSEVLGEIVWLMTQSPLHKQMFIGDLEWFAMPAILLEQFRIFYGPEQADGARAPVACAMWAFVSDETEKRLEGGAHKLAPNEWKGGDRAWLIELVAPFGGQQEILPDLSAAIFAGRPFRFHMTGPDGVRRVESFPNAGAGQRNAGSKMPLAN